MHVVHVRFQSLIAAFYSCKLVAKAILARFRSLYTDIPFIMKNVLKGNGTTYKVL